MMRRRIARESTQRRRPLLHALHPVASVNDKPPAKLPAVLIATSRTWKSSDWAVEGGIAHASSEVGFLTSIPPTPKLEVLLLQKTSTEGGSTLLLYLPEQHSGTHLGGWLPDTGFELRIDVSKLRLEPGLPGR
jgi:hypothetical protein